MKIFSGFFGRNFFGVNYPIPGLLIKGVKLTGPTICKRFGGNCKGACLLHIST